MVPINYYTNQYNIKRNLTDESKTLYYFPSEEINYDEILISFLIIEKQGDIMLQSLDQNAFSFIRQKKTTKYEGEYDFKQFTWGASKEDIISVEGEPGYSSDESTVSYQYTTANNYLWRLDYLFDSNGLCKVHHFNMSNLTNDEDFIKSYYEMKKILSPESVKFKGTQMALLPMK